MGPLPRLPLAILLVSSFAALLPAQGSGSPAAPQEPASAGAAATPEPPGEPEPPGGGAPVPEPATLLLVGSGLVGVAWSVRRGKRHLEERRQS